MPRVRLGTRFASQRSVHSSSNLPLLLRDGPAAARAAQLRYVCDADPGIRRRRRGKTFGYVDASGRRIADRHVLARIRALAIPPAWTDVWICARPDGHVQATGRDARGRKQYRYHVSWRVLRDTAKYHNVVPFGRALPRIRARVEKDLARPRLDRDKVTAIAVRILDETSIRIGNDAYTRLNRSFGLTTLRDGHASLEGTKVTLEFVGKGGRHRRVTLRDRRMVKHLRRCRDLPGQRLLQYCDEHGRIHALGSADVNRAPCRRRRRRISGICGNFTERCRNLRFGLFMSPANVDKGMAWLGMQ